MKCHAEENIKHTVKDFGLQPKKVKTHCLKGNAVEGENLGWKNENTGNIGTNPLTDKIITKKQHKYMSIGSLSPLREWGCYL